MNDDVGVLWASAQTELRKMLTSQNYDMLMATSRAVRISEERVELEVASVVHKELLASHFLGILRTALFEASGRNLKVRLVLSAAPQLVSPEAAAFVARLDFLKQKAQKLEFSLPEDVATFLAACIQSSPTRLEGALYRIAAYAAITREAATLQTAARLSDGILDREQTFLPQYLPWLPTNQGGEAPSSRSRL